MIWYEEVKKKERRKKGVMWPTIGPTTTTITRKSLICLSSLRFIKGDHSLPLPTTQ